MLIAPRPKTAVKNARTEVAQVKCTNAKRYALLYVDRSEALAIKHGPSQVGTGLSMMPASGVCPPLKGHLWHIHLHSTGHPVFSLPQFSMLKEHGLLVLDGAFIWISFFSYHSEVCMVLS